MIKSLTDRCVNLKAGGCKAMSGNGWMLITALKMLFYNKSRFFATLVGISFAFFLAAVQIGLLIGWCNTNSAIIRHARVDVWVMAKQTKAFDYGAAIPKKR